MGTAANPIPDTVTTIPGYPTVLKLFKTGESKFWQVGCYFRRRTFRRSAKTELKSIAVQFAKDFYNTLLLHQSKYPAPIPPSKSFVRVAEDLFVEDQKRIDRAERAASLVTDGKYILEKDLLPFFKDYKLKDITYPVIQRYVDRLTERKVGSNTIRNHFIYLRKVLKHAWKLGILDKLPIFPTISSEDNPREWFSSSQYNLLRKSLADCKGKTARKTYQPITDELRYLATFLVNTFLRPPDIKNLQNKHIEIVKDKYLRINTPGSKTTMSPVVSMDAAVGIYQDLCNFNADLGFGKPDDYVFFPALKNRTYAFQTMRLQFNHVLNEAGLKKSPTGTPRTLYSLRHTAIMFRLLNGGNIDLLTLARNCRTSVDMLERFYARHLTAEMNIDKLTAMRKSTV